MTIVFDGMDLIMLAIGAVACIVLMIGIGFK